MFFKKRIIDVFYFLLFFSASAYLSILDKLVYRLAMPAGSSTAWSMASNQMGKCHQTKLLGEGTTHSILSSAKLVLGSTSHVQYFWTWNQLL